jgi:hypothetical protein
VAVGRALRMGNAVVVAPQEGMHAQMRCGKHLEAQEPHGREPERKRLPVLTSEGAGGAAARGGSAHGPAW